MVSMSPALPKKERRYRKKRSKDYQVEVPPEIPAKGKLVSLLGEVAAAPSPPRSEAVNHNPLVYTTCLDV